MKETPHFLDFKSGYKNLEYLALLDGKVDKEKIENTLELVGLSRLDWKKKVKKYSMGMKPKLALAQVLMDDPELIILDEGSVNKIRDIIIQFKNKGNTIILASHIK